MNSLQQQPPVIEDSSPHEDDIAAIKQIVADGTLIDVDHVMIVLYVLIKEDGRWWTVARHHTLVPS